jgi:phage baseplate assembly protein V
MKAAIKALGRRVQMMVARGVIGAVNDRLKLQGVQIELLDGEVQDDAERFQNYGFSSVPHAGAEAVAVFAGGLRSHALVIAVDDRRYRLTGLSDGEVAVFDDQGQVVHLKRDQLLLKSPFKVVVDAPEVHLGGEGGLAVARKSDAVAGGVITGGSTKVFAL